MRIAGILIIRMKPLVEVYPVMRAVHTQAVMMIVISRLVVICFVSSLFFTTSAQTNERVVPEVFTVTEAQAASILNSAGFRLGEVTDVKVVEGVTMPPGTVAGQSPAAGTALEYGAQVDLIVYRPDNMILVYDDNDITLVNNSGFVVRLDEIMFQSENGTAIFDGQRWDSSTLQPGDCAQLWSVGRRVPKSLPECDESMYWLTTNDSTEHFWIGVQESTTFSLFQDGALRVTCDVAASGRCAFFAGAEDSSDNTPYVMMTYGADYWIIMNPDSSRWMRLDKLTIDNGEDSEAHTLVSIFEVSPDSDVIGDVTRLAPGQCLLAYTGEIPTALPDSCMYFVDMVDVSPFTFWLDDFVVRSANDTDRMCPAAQSGVDALCILPD